MNPTGLLLILAGVFIASRTLFTDSQGQTLAGRLAGGQPGSGSGSGSGAGSGSVPAVQGSVTAADLNSIAKKYGWGPSEVSAWSQVISMESGGNPNAVNPSSGAYGIAQGISGPSWYAANGGNANTVTGQLTAMANYIKSRYGNPINALKFHTTPVAQGGSVSQQNPSGWY